MNFALYKYMLQSSLKTITSYALGSVFYELLIAWVYPSIANNPSLNQMLKQMPANLLKAFGLEQGIQSFSDYLAGEFFNLVWVILMAIATISLAVKLVAAMVDRGSMSFLLAAPLSRAKIITTQIAVLVTAVVVISLFSILGAIFGGKAFNNPVDVAAFVRLGTIGTLMFLVIGGYSMVASVVFDDAKRATGLASAVTVIFYSMYMIGRLSSKLDWLKHWSLFNTFRPVDILHNRLEPPAYIVGLSLAAIGLFLVAYQIFKNRDLSV